MSGTDSQRLHALLGSLGLAPDASAADVEALREKLGGYLREAPEDLRGWAEQQVSQADEALDLLHRSPEVSTPSAAATETPPVAASEVPGLDVAPDGFEPAEPPRGLAPPRPKAGLPKGLKWLALGVVAAGVIIGVYFSGQPAGTPSAMPSNHPNVTAAPTPQGTPVDEARVAELTKKVEADPQDTASIKALSEIYFRAEEYAKAIPWQTKLVEANPKDADARLILGVAYFNTGDMAKAEQHWRQVTVDDPKNTMAFYDLGFAYLGMEPAQPDQARAAWQKVIDLDPTSELAGVVQNHLLAMASSSASPTPGAGPTASASPTVGR